MWILYQELVQYKKKLCFFLVYIKNEQDCWFKLLSKNKDLILNKARDFYKNNKERLKEQVRDK